VALTWDFTKCEDFEALKESDAEWCITETLIWMTMATGIGDLTEKNAPEFYARVNLLEKLDGASIRQTNKETGEVEDYHITFEDVRKRIGMVTNVFPMETRAKWLKRQIGRVMDAEAKKFADTLVSA